MIVWVLLITYYLGRASRSLQQSSYTAFRCRKCCGTLYVAVTSRFADMLTCLMLQGSEPHRAASGEVLHETPAPSNSCNPAAMLAC